MAEAAITIDMGVKQTYQVVYAWRWMLAAYS